MFFARLIACGIIASVFTCYLGGSLATGTESSKPKQLTTVLPSNLPPVPVPKENPLTEEKRLLGKILFWDEQLSIDNSVACGTCHRTEFAGTDPRMLRNPGVDQLLATKDDVFGSPGVPDRDLNGRLQANPHFNHAIQATPRTAQSFFMGLWAAENFWDGRAGGVFIDPQTDDVLISSGGALENQALGPLLNPVEMGLAQRQWQPLLTRLKMVKPLILAHDIPTELANAITQYSSYPALFQAAFGSENITAARIAMAIASYERSLVADQTPWDLAQHTGKNLPGSQQLGWELFKQFKCDECHQPPLFTDNKFHNIGIRALNDDTGRAAISHQQRDHGRMKTPSLRNVALKTHFMHTGEFFNLDQVLDAYAQVPFKELAAKLANGDDYKMNFSEAQRRALINFMTNALTDPRVKNQQFPFDRPKLRTEYSGSSKQAQLAGAPVEFSNITATETPKGVTLIWQAVNGSADYQITRNDGYTDWTTASQWFDETVSSGTSCTYQVVARAAAFNTLTSAKVNIETQRNGLVWLLPLFGVCLLIIVLFIKRKAKLN